MAKYLITGANGQVGSCLTRRLQDQADVLALDRQGLDIGNRDAVFQTVAEFRPDVIINAAAHTAVDRAESEEAAAQAINVDGAKYLAEAASEIGAVILHISTDYVFNGQGEPPYREDDPTDPQSVYGKTKQAGETAVQSANPRSVILRTSWVFGEQGNNFVKTMLRLGAQREELGVVADQFGAPTYAGDIADALIEIAKQILAGKENAFGIYHFSGQPYISWHGFAEAIFRQAVLQKMMPKAPLVKPITTSDYPTPAKRPANSRLDLNKIRQTFGIAPSDWQQALENLKAYIA